MSGKLGKATAKAMAMTIRILTTPANAKPADHKNTRASQCIGRLGWGVEGAGFSEGVLAI